MKFSSRDRRAILLGTAAAVAIVAYFAALKPLQRASLDLARRRATAEEYMERYRAVVAASGSYLAAAETADARLSRLLPATFPGDVHDSVNQLLEKLDMAAEGNEVRIVRVSAIPEESAGPGLLRIGAALECESDLTGLTGFLRTLETSGKLLHVSGLHITAGTSARSSAAETPTRTVAVSSASWSLITGVGICPPSWANPPHSVRHHLS